MGAIDEQVQKLHQVVASLEGRIKDLEVRHLGGSSAPKSTEEIRMILIGPPGAGTSSSPLYPAQVGVDRFVLA